MTILPMVVSLAAQIIVVVAAMVVIAVAVGIAGAASSNMLDPNLLTQQILEATMNSITLVLLLYHILALVGFGAWYYFGCGRPKPQRPGKVFSGRALPVTILIGFFMCVSATAYLLAAEYIVPEAI